MSDIKILADNKAKESFGLDKQSVSEAEAQAIASRINESNQGKAILKDNELKILRPIRD